MTLPGIFSNTTFARIASIVLVLSGCASVPQNAQQPAEQPEQQAAAPRLHSLRISETKETALDKALSSKKSVSKTGSSGLADKTLPIVEVAEHAPLSQAIDLTDESDDLFQRIRHGFAMPDINCDLVLYHQQWYLNRPDYLRRMVERSSLYLFHIVDELDKRHMPTELALLPMVESAYNPMAYSRSKASGLWQFIPSTGKRYNLDQDWWKDERRDIVASTAAALDYLQSIYEMHGDWQLALASYNWGEGAVGRAIAKNRAQGLPTDYLSLTMPGETRNYVPKLQALKNIFSNPVLMAELSLPNVPNRPYFGTVTKMANIDVTVAAKLAEMPVQEFVALNPSHNRPVIKSDTPLVIPADKVETFISNAEAHESSNKPLSMWQTYVMRIGDKLDKVAKRFGIPLSKLKEVNGIFGKTKAKPGQPLLVPGQNASEPDNTAALAELSEMPQQSDARPRAPAVASVQTHAVRKGDALLMIAKRYGMTVAELKQINQLRSNKISAGQQLKVSSGGAKTTASNTKSAKATNAKKASAKTVRYTVRRGDTLTSIARQFKVDADDLIRWNRVSPKALKPGKTLTIQLAQNP